VTKPRTALEKAKARAAERIATKTRKVDGRSIGYADPNYQSRFRITLQEAGRREDRVLQRRRRSRIYFTPARRPTSGTAAPRAAGSLTRSQLARLHQLHATEGAQGPSAAPAVHRARDDAHPRDPERVPTDVGTYHGTLHRLTFHATGSFMQFGHAHTDKAVRSYLSTAWDLILIDEASEFTPRMLSLLQSRARTKLAGDPASDGAGQ
jgi:hypothetical protein